MLSLLANAIITKNYYQCTIVQYILKQIEYYNVAELESHKGVWGQKIFF
jgi:hypothetical protein